MKALTIAALLMLTGALALMTYVATQPGTGSGVSAATDSSVAGLSADPASALLGPLIAAGDVPQFDLEAARALGGGQQGQRRNQAGAQARSATPPAGLSTGTGVPGLSAGGSIPGLSVGTGVPGLSAGGALPPGVTLGSGSVFGGAAPAGTQ